jgi:hypothetical protein
MVQQVDSNGNFRPFYNGERVFVEPLQEYATVITVFKIYEGEEWYWGNVELLYTDGGRNFKLMAMFKNLDEDLLKEVIDRLHYFYLQTDGSMKYPNSAEGDILKLVYKLLVKQKFS